MNIKINYKLYNISDDIWEKHTSMHPIRPEEALRANIKMVFFNKDYNNKDIENMILSEYKMQKNMPNIVKKARQKYKEIM